MPDLRTQTVETVCVAEGSKRESKRPSGRSLQTNPGAECIWSCACASASWTGACAKPGSRLADPGLAEGHHLSWVRWSMGCNTPASSRLERPARLHPLPGGQQSPRARQGRSGLPPTSWERRWTWEVAWRTESRSNSSRIVRVSQRDSRRCASQRDSRLQSLQTLCKRLQRHNRHGAAKGSRGGWYRRRCVLLIWTMPETCYEHFFCLFASSRLITLCIPQL